MGIIPAAIRPTDIIETPLPRETPRACALRLARAKAAAAVPVDGEVVLAADTVVALGQRLLGKPADAGEAEAFLRLLSGRRHRVITAVAVATPVRTAVRAVETAVRFKRLDETEIRGYLASNEWQDKAGGYAIQGRAAGFVPWINGSYGAVVGLPLAETLGLLQATGIRSFAP